jgi:hypothetical protein
VYSDADVKIFENPHALARFRIVHTAIQVAPGHALDWLRSGQLDPRQTTLLETTPPSLAPPPSPESDFVQPTLYEANRIQVTTRTEAPGLLVLSEVYYPAWQAFIDGRPTQLYVADHAFRAVSIPNGTHQVELRYESTTLLVGLLMSACGYMLLVILVAAAARPRRLE